MQTSAINQTADVGTLTEYGATSPSVTLTTFFILPLNVKSLTKLHDTLSNASVKSVKMMP